MQKLWPGVCFAAVLLTTATASASDHRDGPLAIANPQGDIGDTFAWMSPDATQLNIAMTVVPFAGATPPGGTSANPTRFSSAIKYVFDLNSRPRAIDPWVSVAAAARDRTRLQVIATFDDGTPQVMRLWVRDVGKNRLLAYITGDPANPSGLSSSDGRVRVYAGLRKDPAFVNTAGVLGMINYLRDNLTSFPAPNGAGCRALTVEQRTAVAQQLATGTNTFASANTLAIVVSLDKMLVDTSGSLVAVWASTHR